MKLFKSFEEKFGNHVIKPIIENADNEGFGTSDKWLVIRDNAILKTNRTLSDARRYIMSINKDMKKSNEKYNI
jgi:hypothetical protein